MKTSTAVLCLLATFACSATWYWAGWYDGRNAGFKMGWNEANRAIESDAVEKSIEVLRAEMDDQHKAK